MAKQKVCVPDLGGIDAVTVVEVLIAPGKKVLVDQSVYSLESDKASMDIPATHEGVITEVYLKSGQTVSEGMLAYEMMVEDAVLDVPDVEKEALVDVSTQSAVVPQTLQREDENSGASIYAGPGVRRLAHALGISLQSVKASGLRNRITRQDLYDHIKRSMLSSSDSTDALPVEQYEKFGPVSAQSLSKIKQATAAHMRRCWRNIPHVTQHDKVDITDLESFRQQCKPLLVKEKVRLTLLPFVLKAVVLALKDFPYMNASYDADQQALMIKAYYHLGFAVDTPQGLLVPVLRHVDQRSIRDIAQSLQMMSEKARQSTLLPGELQGGSFTVTSLGGIGGEYFTPIVNGPQVAILGIGKAQMQPVWDGQTFIPRLMMPLSLSYDHRVIDGAQALRFLLGFSKVLQALCQGMTVDNIVQGLD